MKIVECLKHFTLFTGVALCGAWCPAAVVNP